MKILILNTYDTSGGASRAAHRLLCSLSTSEEDAQYLVLRKSSNEKGIIGLSEKKSKYLISVSSVIDNIHEQYYKNLESKFSISYFSLTNTIKEIEKIKPDIVHLHWINNGFLPIRNLLKLNIPIVWSMHDNWAFTGGCHYDMFCARYYNSCGKCPMLHSKFDYDLSRINYFRKKHIYYKLNNITFIGLSKWMANEAGKSSLLKHKRIINLPNPIDTSLYKSKNKKDLRIKYNIDPNAKIVCFGAMNPKSDIRKGYNYLHDALQKIDKSSKFEFMIFGGDSQQIENDFKNKIHRLGFISDEDKMIDIYNLADIVVVPSIQENLSNTIMESMSCGTPVVAFNIGGNPDMIDHKINGYLAQPYEPEDLAEGINWVLNHPDYESISINARAKVVREFDSKVVAQKYIELYQSILNKGK